MLIYVWAERCDGPFFMGWWLYADEVIEGKVQNKRHRYWLREEWMLEYVRTLASALGEENLPEVHHREKSAFAQTFAQRFPTGILLTGISTWSKDWELATAKRAPDEYALHAACGDPGTRDGSKRPSEEWRRARREAQEINK